MHVCAGRERAKRSTLTNDCIPNRPRTLNFPSGSSESPTPASAEGASCADGTDGREIKSLLRFSSNSRMLTSGMFLYQIWCQKLSTVFLSEVMSNLSFKTRVLVKILSCARKKCSEGGD